MHPYEDEPLRNYQEDQLDRADHERTERKDKEMEELWANRVPTPETDKHTGLKYSAAALVATSRDLERRLTLARIALTEIAANPGKIEGALLAAGNIARKALEQIAPKP